VLSHPVFGSFVAGALPWQGAWTPTPRGFATMRLRTILIMLAVSLGLFGPRNADAFCGFYVSGADAQLYNNATMVVLMREGTRTVLSMRNNYQGPPEAFAMVIPVPVVLQEEHVKTLSNALFARIDKLSAPRLVEYWEQDPCLQAESENKERAAGKMMAPAPAAEAEAAKDDLGVTVEAQFEVGEYEIVILSADDSVGLDKWLRREKYNMPKGAEAVLKPYVESDMKFFVAKVNPEKVKFVDGMAELSPLRFHYDDDKFSLPVRLGLLNAKDKQDLIVNILARGKRYELANYENVTIPTNLNVGDSVREDFGAFYASLFDMTLEKNPKAVVTEYSWDASSCDPCPEPPLNIGEIMTLGADSLTDAEGEKSDTVTIQSVMGTMVPDAKTIVDGMQSSFDGCMAKAAGKALSAGLGISAEVGKGGEVLSAKSQLSGNAPDAVVNCITKQVKKAKFGAPSSVLDARVLIQMQLGALPAAQRFRGGFVLTRLHARYDKASLTEDLVFKEAKAIVGGREFMNDGKIEWASRPASVNNFQGRYAIRHEWKGPITCAKPIRGVWGGPPKGEKGDSQPKPALNLAFASRGKFKLASVVEVDIPELSFKTEVKPAAPKKPPPVEEKAVAPPPPPPDEGCGCRAVGGASADSSHIDLGGSKLPASFLLLTGLAGLALVRRRRS